MMDTLKSRFRFLWNSNRKLVIAAIAGDAVLLTVAIVAIVLLVVL